MLTPNIHENCKITDGTFVANAFTVPTHWKFQRQWLREETHAGRAKMRWLHQEDLPAGLLTGPHCPALEHQQGAATWDSSFLVVWKSPSVALNWFHGCSDLLCEPRRAWFMGVQPTLRKTRSWSCSLLLPCWSPSYFLIESSHSVNLLWSCELCVQSWYFDMNMVRKQWTTLWSKCLVV